MEPEFLLEQSIEDLGVLASIRAVQPVVRAHEARGLGAGRVGERPQVELVDGPVVDVGRDGLVAHVGDGAVRGKHRVSHDLLLVPDEVLRRGLDTGRLHAVDRLLHGDSRQVRIRREALPVAARVGGSSEGSGHGSIRVSVHSLLTSSGDILGSCLPEEDMGSLGLELPTQR